MGLVLAVLAVVGCGGGDGASAEEFAADAQAICADATRTTAPLQRQIVEAARLSEPALVFRRTALLERRLAAEAARVVEELDATPHPEDDEALHTWMATLRRSRSAREDLADAYAGRDLQEIARAAAAVDRHEQRIDAFARERGMPACTGVS